MQGVSKTEYREPGEGWWNTYETDDHMEILKYLIQIDAFQGGATMDKLYDLTDMSSSTFDEEVKFVTRTLQSYYDSHADDKWLVMCHNDPHGGNIMRNKDDPFDPSKLELLDFDNAGYGFRIWDLLYNMVNWNIEYNGADGETRLVTDINEFFDAYIGAQTYDTNLTRSTLWEELGAHAPYFYLERMTFLTAFGIFDPTYHSIMRALYDDAAGEYGRKPAHDSAVSTDAILASFILPLLYLFL